MDHTEKSELTSDNGANSSHNECSSDTLHEKSLNVVGITSHDENNNSIIAPEAIKKTMEFRGKTGPDDYCNAETIQSELTSVPGAIEETLNKLKWTQSNLDEIKFERDYYKEHYFVAISQREDLKRQLGAVSASYNAISNAFFWRVTKPVRSLLDVLKRMPLVRLFDKGLRSLKQNGWIHTWRKVKNRLNRRQYYAAVVKPLFTPEELEKQRNDIFRKKSNSALLYLFSILQ